MYCGVCSGVGYITRYIRGVLGCVCLQRIPSASSDDLTWPHPEVHVSL